MAEWVWVSMSHATFGLAIRDGVIVDAPPIARRWLGKPEGVVAEYYRRQGARFVRLPPL